MKESAVCATAGPSVKLPVLSCPTCELLDTTVLAPGSGPHVAALRCPAGHFIKWAPKALVERKTLMGSVNRVILIGTISKYGVTVKYAQTGTPCANFTLVLTEQGQDGKPHATFIDCECWGRKAEAASALEAGQLALFEGKLAKRKKGEQWETIVSGFELTPALVPQASMTGSSN